MIDVQVGFNHSCEGLNMAKEVKEVPKKADIMREALAGGVSETAAIVTYAKERYGVELTTQAVSQFKSNQKRKESQVIRRERPARALVQASESALFKLAEPSGNRLTREELSALVAMMKRVGADSIRQVLDIAEFLS